MNRGIQEIAIDLRVGALPTIILPQERIEACEAAPLSRRSPLISTLGKQHRPHRSAK